MRSSGIKGSRGGAPFVDERSRLSREVTFGERKKRDGKPGE